MNIALKRIYESYSPDDGLRILVDRLWPRGLAKEKAHIDLWLKNAAPSTELRHWFNHETSKWEEFRRRYVEELRRSPHALEEFHEAVRGHEHITLLYAAKDEQHNQAVVLRDFLTAKEQK